MYEDECSIELLLLELLLHWLASSHVSYLILP